MLNARVRIVGGRNTPNLEDHVQFFTTFNAGEVSEPAVMVVQHDHSVSEAEFTTPVHPQSAAKAEISEALKSHTLSNAEVCMTSSPVHFSSGELYSTAQQ